MKEIYERLGINTDISIERSKFNNRINLVAKNISDLLDSEDYELIDHQISFRLGSEDDFIDFLTTADFNETLLWCEMTLNALSENNKRAFVHLQKMITQAIDESAIDLGVAYKNGKFYRTGAKELDQTLVIETLDWLKEFPVTQNTFDEALREYLRKDYADTVTKCYSALESLVKDFLQSDRGLDKLLPDLLSKLSLSDQWKGILVHFCNYAHEFGSRHGKRDRTQAKKLDQAEVEAYIYQTGLLMRLICRAQHFHEKK